MYDQVRLGVVRNYVPRNGNETLPANNRLRTDRDYYQGSIALPLLRRYDLNQNVFHP